MANNGVIDQIVSPEAEKQLQGLQKQLKDAETDMNNLLKVTTALSGEIKNVSSFQQLNEVLKKQKDNTEKLNAVDREREKVVKEIQTLQARQIALATEEAKQREALRNSIQKQTRELRNQVKEQNSANGSIEQMRARLSQMRKEYDSLSATLRNSKAGKQAAKDIKALNDEVTKLEAATGRNNRTVGGYFNAISKGFKNILGALGIVTGIRLLVNTFKDGYKTIVEFEQANADLASILGTNRKSIGELTKDAQRLGAVTEYTASQVTGLQTELAKLGFNRKEIIDSTGSILQFATATGAELPEAAKLAGAALRAFNLDSSEMTRVVSVMGVGTTKSALDFRFLETAMSTIAPVAKTFGFTIEDTVALLGTLADSGFDASSAATATRNILLNLADSGGKLAQRLGRPVKNLDDLAKGLKELNDQGVDLATTLDLTDKRSVSAFNTFLRGADKLTTLRDSVTDVSEELRKMQEERLNTVAGQTKLLESAWEGLMLAFSNSAGVFKSIIGYVTTLVNGITDLIIGAEEVRKRELEASNTFGFKEASKELNDLIKIYEESPLFTGKTQQEIAQAAINELVAKYEKDIKDINQGLEDIAPGGMMRLNDEQQAKNVEDLNHLLTITEGKLSSLKQRADLLNKTPLTIGGDDDTTTPTDKELKEFEKQQKARQKLASDIAKTQNDIEQLKLKNIVDINKAIYDNDKETIQQRRIALEVFSDAINAQASQQLAYQLNANQQALNDEISNVKLSVKNESEKQKQLALIREKYRLNEEQIVMNYDNAQLKRQEDYNKGVEKLEKDLQSQITTNLQTALADRNREIERSQSEQMAALSEQLKNREITQTEYDKAVRDLERKSQKEAINAEIDMLQDLLLSVTDNKDERLKIEKQLQDARLKLEQATNDAIVQDNEEAAKKMAEVRKQILEQVQTFITAQFDKTIQGYDAELEKIQERKDAELAALDEKGASEETYTELKKQIEADADVQTQQIEERKKQAQIKQATFEKAVAVTGIIVSTGKAIINQAATTPLPAGAPLIAAIAALGALQLATALAQPIPEYTAGTANHIGGPAIVGDGGRPELVLEPSGKSWVTPSVPTLVDLPKGTEVLPEVPEFKPDMGIISSDFARMRNSRAEVENSTNQALITEMKGMRAEMKELRKDVQNSKAEMNVNLNPRGQWNIQLGKEKNIHSMSKYFGIKK